MLIGAALPLSPACRQAGTAEYLPLMSYEWKLFARIANYRENTKNTWFEYLEYTEACAEFLYY